MRAKELYTKVIRNEETANLTYTRCLIVVDHISWVDHTLDWHQYSQESISFPQLNPNLFKSVSQHGAGTNKFVLGIENCKEFSPNELKWVIT